MKAATFFIGFGCAMGLAAWTYSETHKTRDAISRVAKLQSTVHANSEAISVLEAEWAYLNRPERLMLLVDSNFERLELIPMTAEHFGSIGSIPDGEEIEDYLSNRPDLGAPQSERDEGNAQPELGDRTTEGGQFP